MSKCGPKCRAETEPNRFNEVVLIVRGIWGENWAMFSARDRAETEVLHELDTLDGSGCPGGRDGGGDDRRRGKQHKG